ncbi:hypothetical protein NC653_000309 [Populus alba x Populus x berolinensis]|uniref:Uncharacterized protein n=1 Tax=Populus alba x Populus x berolinensis TaxID=444605 RepID=A0AAD6WEA8_9ROSI|nr:hypothetical protein NC653_000309 [Populus alba x Populus x berolinensis]
MEVIWTPRTPDMGQTLNSARAAGQIRTSPLKHRPGNGSEEAAATLFLLVDDGRNKDTEADVLEKIEGAVAMLKAWWLAAAGGAVEGDYWLLLTKDVSPRCSRWSQVCRNARCVADAVLIRTNWQGARLSRRSVPGEKNKYGQGAMDTSLGFAKERGMSEGKFWLRKGAVTIVRGRVLGLKVCWGKQQQRRKLGGCVGI